MALRNTPAADFEAEDTGAAEQVAQDAGVKETAGGETFAGIVATAVVGAIQTTRAVSTARSVVTQNVLSNKKDAFHIEWDSVPRISAEQGAFVVKDSSEEDLGGEIKIELMSYQSRWVATPKDNKADIELVKFSDDGIEASDGTNLKEHVKDLLEQGWPKSKIDHRCVIVGELVSTAKGGESLKQGLIQVDLPESGRKSFEAYQLQASWAVGKGRKSADDVSMLTLKAVKDKTKSGDVYTKIVIS